MKIEIGESLCYSYLRHVKQCWLVQSNWKVSEHWVKQKPDEDLQELFWSMRGLFDPDGSVFKETKDASQFLRQGEIDVVGVGQDGSVHALDVAFHEAGLNYGGGADKRVLKKLLRTVMILKAYHPAETKLHVYFVSPKVHRAVQQPLEDVFAELAGKYPEIGWHLLTNDDFAEKVVRPTLEKAGSVADTSELFVRAAKLLALAESSLSSAQTTSTIPRQGKDGLTTSQRDRPRNRGSQNVQECIKILAQFGYTRSEPSDDPAADFLAYRQKGTTAIKVRVATRVDIRRANLGKDLYMSFPADGRWYLVPHDELVKIADETTPWLGSDSWQDKGWYSSRSPSRVMLDRLAPFAL